MEQLRDDVWRKVCRDVEEGVCDKLPYKEDDGLTHPLKSMPYSLFSFVGDAMSSDKFAAIDFMEIGGRQHPFDAGVSFFLPLIDGRYLLSTMRSPKVELETGLVFGNVLYIIILDMFEMLEKDDYIGWFRLVSNNDDGVFELGAVIGMIMDDIQGGILE